MYQLIVNYYSYTDQNRNKYPVKNKINLNESQFITFTYKYIFYILLCSRFVLHNGHVIKYYFTLI